MLFASGQSVTLVTVLLLTASTSSTWAWRNPNLNKEVAEVEDSDFEAWAIQQEAANEDNFVRFFCLSSTVNVQICKIGSSK